MHSLSALWCNAVKWWLMLSRKKNQWFFIPSIADCHFRSCSFLSSEQGVWIYLLPLVSASSPKQSPARQALAPITVPPYMRTCYVGKGCIFQCFHPDAVFLRDLLPEFTGVLTLAVEHPSSSDAGWRGVPVLVRKDRADMTTFKHTACFKLDVFKQKWCLNCNLDVSVIYVWQVCTNIASWWMLHACFVICWPVNFTFSFSLVMWSCTNLYNN